MTIDAIIADTLRYATDYLNNEGIAPDDIMFFFQNKEGKYVVVFKRQKK